MTSSRATAPRQVPPPPGSREGTPYSRFIPREELHGFANWVPGALSDDPGAASPKRRATDHAPAPNAARPAAEPSLGPADVHAARQAGYQDGYRDGLVALESFKQSTALQMSGQFAPLLQSFDAQLAGLEQRIALTVAQVASQLARQVVRSELQTRPELISKVAQEAVQAVLLSARQIVLQVNPADLEMIHRDAADALAARGARLVGQHHIERGGCLVETDAGTVDARIEARWHDAVHALGTQVVWADVAPAASPHPPEPASQASAHDTAAQAGTEANP